MRPKLQNHNLYSLNISYNNSSPNKPNIWSKAKTRKKTKANSPKQHIQLPYPKICTTTRNYKNFPYACLNYVPPYNKNHTISLPSLLFHLNIRYIYNLQKKKNIKKNYN